MACRTAPCCDLHEVPLLDADVERISKAAGRPAADFVDEADGWLMLKGAGLPGSGCVFGGHIELEAGGRRFRGCTIHAHRPEACRTYPFVLGEDEAGHPAARRDDAVCPWSEEFPAEPGVLERLMALTRNLETERAARQARRASHP